MPVLNAATFIGEAIGSALRQSFADLEVLVVDNGSTDGTDRIVRQFADPRVHILSCDKRGAAAARNLGLSQASGRFIQFLDADDVLGSTKIELQIDAIGAAGPRRVVTSCSWLRFKERPEEAQVHPERVWPVENPVEWLLCSLSGGGMMQTGGWLVHRDLIDAAGPWDETLSLHDDGEYFTRVLLQAERQVFVPEARVYYRATPASLSRQRNRQAIASAFKVCQLRDRHILAVKDDEHSRTAIATQYLQFAYEFANDAPDLSVRAMSRIRELDVRPVNTVGGAWFRRLSTLLGYRTSWKVRRTLKGLWPAIS